MLTQNKNLRSLFKSRKAFALASVAIVAVTVWACGKSELKYNSNRPSDNQVVATTPTQSLRRGVLRLDGTEYADEGFLNYTIYDDGVINYHGSVRVHAFKQPAEIVHYDYYRREYHSYLQYAYALSTWATSINVAFSGNVAVNPKTIQSRSYEAQGTTITEDKVNFVVRNIGGNTRTVDVAFRDEFKRRDYPTSGDPTDYKTTGAIVIDTSGDIIDIASVQMTGRVYGIEMTLSARK